MDERTSPSRPVEIAMFAVRHVVALITLVLAACLLWTVTYAGLLAWAIITDGGLGGPLAYPGGLGVVAAATAALALLILMPATVLAEVVARRGAFRFLFQIPLASAFAAVLSLAAGFALSASTNLPSGPSPFRAAAWVFVLSLLPLGLYWWVSQAGPIVVAAYRLVAKTFPNLRRA